MEYREVTEEGRVHCPREDRLIDYHICEDGCIYCQGLLRGGGRSDQPICARPTKIKCSK